MDGDQRKILLIEDEEPMLQALTDTFNNDGYSVYQARDGEVGLELAFKEHPDIILLDILMPRMDGMSMIKKLRANLWGKQVPVILLTNVNPDRNDIIQGIVSFQPAYYLVKSDVTLEGILAKVKEVLTTA